MARDRKHPRAASADREARQPRSAFAAGPERQPRGVVPGVAGSTPLWAYRLVDLGGPWCWTALDRDGLRDVLGRLRDYESMTWAEIEGPSGSHFVSLGSLARRARERLLEIGQDDVDALFSLRISGRQRVWGIRADRVLRFLWWDPIHEVCPSPKKHT